MKLKKFAACAVALTLFLSLCGCSFSASMENLLTAPKLTAEQNEIYQELINSVGRNIKLKYPRNGEFRSAFVLYDIDGEPGDEAMVFYESSDIRSGESALRLKFLDKSSGRWEAAYDLACPGGDIESVTFAELSGDNSDETLIILSCTLLNQTEKAFSALKYKNKKPVECLSSTYSCMEIADLNCDNINELVVVTVNKELKTASASMYADGGDKMELLSNTRLYGGASDYICVTKGLLDERTPALFLDYSTGGGMSGTDVIFCRGGYLYCPDSVENNIATGIISRQINNYMAEIYSTDIDGDGFVEIPSTTPFPGYETLMKSERLCAAQWYTVQNGRFIQKAYSYFSSKYRFALIFPNRWIGVVTAVADFNSNDIIFIAYDESTGLNVTEDNEIMRIHSVEKDDKEAVAAAGGMKLIGESDDMLYYAVTNGGHTTENLSLTESELAAGFVVL